MIEVPQSTLSYPEMFERLRGSTDPDVLRERCPKVCREAQARAPGAARIWFSDVHATPQGRVLSTGKLLAVPTTRVPSETAYKQTKAAIWRRPLALASVHVLVAGWAVSTFTFSWAAIALGIIILKMIGVVTGFHRMLSHKSFTTTKPLEYLIAFLGTCAGQSHPIEWVSRHRQHHRHTDTPLDPHSPHEGFWWGYCLWLTGTEWSECEYGNCPDLLSQSFYRFLLHTTTVTQYVIRPIATYHLGGMPALVWTWGFPIVFVLHVTLFVSTAGHIWGRRPYATGDLSTNIWWLALLSFGDSFHNNHHQFPTSARIGLEWWEFDACWLFIRALELLGLAWDVKVPSKKERALARRTSQAGGEDVEPRSPHATAEIAIRSTAAMKAKAA